MTYVLAYNPANFFENFAFSKFLQFIYSKTWTVAIWNVHIVHTNKFIMISSNLFSVTELQKKYDASSSVTDYCCPKCKLLVIDLMQVAVLTDTTWACESTHTLLESYFF